MEGERGLIEIEGADAARAARGALSATDKAVLGAAAMPRDRGLPKLLPLLASGTASPLATQAQTGASALHKACMKANPGCVAALRSAGWSLLQLDLMKRTPVHLLATQNASLLRKCLQALHSTALVAALLMRDGGGVAPLGVGLAKLLQLANSVDPTNINTKTPGVYEFAANIMHIASHTAHCAQCPPDSAPSPAQGSYRPAFVSSRPEEVFAVPSETPPPPIPLAVLIKLSRFAGPDELLRCLLWMEDPKGYPPHVLLSPPLKQHVTPTASPNASRATSPVGSPATSRDGNASDSFEDDTAATPTSQPAASPAADKPRAQQATAGGEQLAHGWTAHAVWWGALLPARGTAGFALPLDLAQGAVGGIVAAQGQAAPPPGEKLVDVLSSKCVLWALRRPILLSRAKLRKRPPPEE